MAETTRTKRSPLGWVKKHKVLTAVLLVVVLVAVLVLRAVLGAKKAAGTTYQYVRTTILQKTSLTDSVSVNGTVQSSDKASVTAADGVKTYKVTTVNVAVGDTVKKGDVIATLDTSDLEKQIEKAEQSYSDTVQDAQTSVERAASDLEVSTVQHENNLIDLQAKIAEADESAQDARDDLAKAQGDQSKAQSDYDNAVNKVNELQSAYDSATSSLSTYISKVESAAASQNQALAELNNAIASGNSAAQEAAQKNLDEINSYYQAVSAELAEKKNDCSVPSQGLYGYDAIEAALKQAKSDKENAENALTSAKNNVTSAEKQIDSADQQVKSAHDSYDNEKNYSNLTNKSQSLEDSQTKLEQASRTPDTLETLQSNLDDCTLTATMDGTITALNATVGDVCSGTVATIQNVDDLTVEVTIPASSVGKLKTGMQCNITSDATDDTVTGTLTRIDPVANDSGSFGATVTINGQDSGLLIGISAKVEIIVNEKDNVFTVPRDAVGTNDDGSTYVLRKTGGEGVDMTFEQVTVTEGDKNDYYVEITGDDLNEGDVIRATADLTQGIETSSDSDFQMMDDGSFYVGDGENMPDGVTIARTDDAGGPGGGGPGGAPDSGPGGQ